MLKKLAVPSLELNETQAIEAARKRVGAKKATLKTAEAIAEAGNFVTAPVGPFSAKIANWPAERITDAAKLAQNLKGMRNRRIWVDGKESRWDEVFGFSWCIEQRTSAYRPVEYCFGLDEKRLNQDGYTYVKEFHSSGVVPRTASLGLSILKRALQAAVPDSSSFKGVLAYRHE